MMNRQKGLKLVSTILTLGLLIFLSLPISAADIYEDDYEIIRHRRMLKLLGGSTFDISNEKIANKILEVENEGIQYWESMSKTSSLSKDFLWHDLNIREAYRNNDEFAASKHMNKSYLRLRSMALAYKHPHSKLYNNSQLMNDINHGLEYMYQNWYNEDREMHKNYYYFKAAIPSSIVDILTLCYEDIEKNNRSKYLNATRKFLPNLNNTTGANRAARGLFIIMRGVLAKDYEEVTRTTTDVASMFEYVTSGDGFYEDGSFILHGTHTNVFNYGLPMLKKCNDYMFLLEGTDFEIHSPAKSNMYNWVIDTFEPLIYKGQAMDASVGRQIASQGSQTNNAKGHNVIGVIAEISTYAPVEYANRYREMVKYLVLEDDYDFFEHATLEQIGYVTDILENAESRGPLEGVYHFNGNDKILQRKSNYAYMVSMHSKRVSNYESINKENLKGWHQADGMTYLYDLDYTRYEDDFWPTVDSNRLPGTTYIYGENVPSGRSDQSWVGGAELDEKYSSAGMILHPVNSTLFATKSWFMLDDEIVALGSGIRSNNGRVETTIENYKLNAVGDNELVINGSSISTDIESHDVVNNAQWMYLNGNFGANIGYYFPKPTRLNTLRSNRSDSWYSINQNWGDHDIKSKNYLSVWIDHGTRPSQGEYAYVILPSKDQNETRLYAEEPEVEILKHTNEVHAVRENTQGVIAANFFGNHGGSVEHLSVNKKASVIVQEKDGVIKVSISDPTQENTGTIAVDINKYGQLVSKDDEIVVINEDGTIQLLVDVNGARGNTFTAYFKEVQGPQTTYLVEESFTTTNLNEFPNDFIEDSHVVACDASVQLDPLNASNKALYLYDNSPDKGINNNFNSPEHQLKVSKNFKTLNSGLGEISWRVLIPQVINNDFNYITLGNDSTDLLKIVMAKNKEVRIVSEEGTQKFGNAMLYNQWVSIKVVIDFDNESSSIYVNNMKLATIQVDIGEGVNRLSVCTNTRRHTEYYVDDILLKLINSLE